MVTGLYDTTAVESGLVMLPEGEHDGDTEAAHIIPESTNHGIDKSVPKVCQTSSIFTTFFLYSYACNIGPPVCGGVGDVVNVFVDTRAAQSRVERKRNTSIREHHDPRADSPYGIGQAPYLV